MRYLWFSLVIALAQPAHSQVTVDVGVQIPGVRIGINLPALPDLEPVPGLPVYYAPRSTSNYFFYDGMFWAYSADNWYSADWYDGPWYAVSPFDVPLFVLRVPVRYYRSPPAYFRSWRPDGPPQWGEHWGRQWASRRQGWDHWDRNRAPVAAPLPEYQHRFPRGRYPETSRQQRAIRSVNDRYTPRDNRDRGSNVDRSKGAQRPRNRPDDQRVRETPRQSPSPNTEQRRPRAPDRSAQKPRDQQQSRQNRSGNTEHRNDRSRPSADPARRNDR